MSEVVIVSETEIPVVVTPVAVAPVAPTHTTSKVETMRIESKELRVMRDLHAFAIESAEKEVDYKSSIKKLEGDLKKSAESVAKPLLEEIEELKKANAKLEQALSSEKAKKDSKFFQGIGVSLFAWLLIRYILGLS